jgi:hypothetical protein
MQLIGLKVSLDSAIDLTNTVDLAKIGVYTEGSHIYRAEKKYTRGREREIFELMENGCRISDGHLFELLNTI